MATPADAELILKLYDLRREPLMRKARKFVAFEMPAKTQDDLLKVQRGAPSEENAMWRQAISYWEMAASFVLRGALDGDLFLDTNAEGIFLFTKFHALYKAATGADFMPQTAALIQKYPAARERSEAIAKRLSSLANDPVVKADESFNKG